MAQHNYFLLASIITLRDLLTLTSIDLPTQNILTIALMACHTQRHRNNADHKDCKVGEVVAVTCHNITIIHYCLTSLSSPLCIPRYNDNYRYGSSAMWWLGLM